MNYIILSEIEAMFFEPPISEKSALVRITGFNEAFPPMLHYSEFDWRCHFKFDDITEDSPMCYTEKLFDDEMANQLISFFKKIGCCDNFVVHCQAGISRSSAIAASYALYLKDIEGYNRIMNNTKYYPNPTVLRIMKKNLGLIPV